MANINFSTTNWRGEKAGERSNKIYVRITNVLAFGSNS